MSALDPDVTGQLAADLPREDFVRIIRSFEEDLGRLARQLQAAVAEGDLDGYRRAAHSLAGASAAVGAHGLERAARIGMDRRSTEEPAEIARRIGEAASATLAELAALADNPPGPG